MTETTASKATSTANKASAAASTPVVETAESIGRDQALKAADATAGSSPEPDAPDTSNPNYVRPEEMPASLKRTPPEQQQGARPPVTGTMLNNATSETSTIYDDEPPAALPLEDAAPDIPGRP